MGINGTNPFIYVYNIKVAALYKCLALSNIPSSVIDNALNVIVSTFLQAKFAIEVT